MEVNWGEVDYFIKNYEYEPQNEPFELLQSPAATSVDQLELDHTGRPDETIRSKNSGRDDKHVASL